jgi:hypothetical protein
VAGRYAESVAGNRRAVQLRPRFTSAWRTLASAAALSGDLETGRSALLEAKRLQPDLSIEGCVGGNDQPDWRGSFDCHDRPYLVATIVAGRLPWVADV